MTLIKKTFLLLAIACMLASMSVPFLDLHLIDSKYPLNPVAIITLSWLFAIFCFLHFHLRLRKYSTKVDNKNKSNLNES